MSSKAEDDIAYKPFTSAATGTDLAFWRAYVQSRPTPSDDFLELIYAYCREHGTHEFGLAHDVGTGPGNIAARLASRFESVVGSDVNESALAAGPHLLRPEECAKVSFVACPAEEISTSATVPSEARHGRSDLVVVSECMPLLDADRSIRGFADLLKPKGTLAVYFYGRPFFVETPWASRCNELYAKITTRICQMYWPFKDSPGYPFHARSAEALISWLDSIAIPHETWTQRERHKWNSDRPLLFNDEAGYDFALESISRVDAGEKIIERTDLNMWSTQWDIARVKSYLNSNYPRHQERAGDRYLEIQILLEELAEAMGGEDAVRQVGWPVVLLLATRK